MYSPAGLRIAKYCRPFVPTGSDFSSKHAVLEVSNEVSSEVLDDILVSFVATLFL